MIFLNLDATYGRLEHGSFAFSPGLNIIEFPGEAEMSSFSAFLRTMLFGRLFRGNASASEAKRFAPQSGEPMQGTLGLESDVFGAVTIRRSTEAPDHPMGQLSVVRTGTEVEIHELTIDDCGVRLLGVSEDVYTSGAYIRQSTLAVDDPDLKRRIAALISAAKENRGYAEAAAALKKQVVLLRDDIRDRRLPALEHELSEAEVLLSKARALREEMAAADAELASLKGRTAELQSLLTAHNIADRREQYLKREQARHDADSKDREVRAFRRRLTDANVPSPETLEKNRVRLQRLGELEQQYRSAVDAQEKARQKLARLDAKTPRPSRPPLFAALFAAGALLAIALRLLPLAVSPGVRNGCTAAAALWALTFLALLVWERNKRAEFRQRRENSEAALHEAENSCSASQSELENAKGLIYAEIPAEDPVSAAAYVEENLAQYEALSRLEEDAQRYRLIYESTPKPDLSGVPAFSAARPEQSAEELQAELERIAKRQAELRVQAGQAAGRISALSDLSELEKQSEQKRAALDDAIAECEALSLTAETLEKHDSWAQEGIVPPLGTQTAAYYTALTEGLHDTSAPEQLCLALRLAVCGQALPEDPSVPLVLDDALNGFDDEGCRVALELLLREAETRQILLTTRRHREAVYLAGRDNAHILAAFNH